MTPAAPESFTPVFREHYPDVDVWLCRSPDGLEVRVVDRTIKPVGIASAPVDENILLVEHLGYDLLDKLFDRVDAMIRDLRIEPKPGIGRGDE